MGGRAVGKGVIHGGEFGLHIVLAQPDKLEGLDHDLRVVVPHRPGGQLHAVANQVVLVSGDGQGINLPRGGLLQNLQPAVGHGEGVVAELQLAALLPDLVHGEVHNPAEFVPLLVHVAGAERPQLVAQHPGRLLGGGQLPRRQTYEAPRREAQGLYNLFLYGLDKLGDAAHDLPVLVIAEPVGLLPGLHLHLIAQPVDLLAGALEVRHHDGLDGIARKGREPAPGQQPGGVGEGQVDAQVRLVGAVPVHGLQEGDPLERGLGRHVIRAVTGEDGGEHPLQHGEHIVLVGESHLHVQLVELAGGAVAPGVLVPEAGGNLEVLVKAGGHEQLLELLGGLGQGVELAGVLAGGDEVVPRPLGGGGGEDGGGDLQKSLAGHGGAQGGHHVAAQDDVVFHLRVAQVQIAVLEPLGLVRLPGAVDGEGQLVVPAAAQHLDPGGDDLDVAGGQLGVFAVPLPDHALHRDGGLLVQPLDSGHHLLRLDDHLGGAVEVPEHQEGQVLAHLPDVLHPAHEFDLLPRVFDAKVVTGVCARLNHDNQLQFVILL